MAVDHDNEYQDHIADGMEKARRDAYYDGKREGRAGLVSEVEAIRDAQAPEGHNKIGFHAAVSHVLHELSREGAGGGA